MKKFLCFNLLALALLTGCSSYPLLSEQFTINGKWPGHKIVQNDMKACGFNSFSDTSGMSDDEVVNAHLCMEKKGYLSQGTPICKWKCYKYHPACEK